MKHQRSIWNGKSICSILILWVVRNREWLGHPNLLRRPSIAFSSSEYLVGLFVTRKSFIKI
ncbi:MAG TPA: hypothetical protein VH500_08095 [Nitrososphaeraceae archaeon]